MILKEIVNEFSQLNCVDAVVLSGSQTGLFNDEISDFDVYVYSNEHIPLDFRQKLAEKYGEKYEVGNDFFEDGDEFLLKENGKGLDLMYRSLANIEGELDWVWRKHNAKVGYTTAVLHNIRTSKILFDRYGEFKKLQDELYEPYPQELKNNIIKKNLPLIKGKMAATFYDQIEWAVKRNDLVSQNHRTAAFFASYFDVIFALNEQTHPGEKRLVAYAEKICKILPQNFRMDVENVIRHVGSDDILYYLDVLIGHMSSLSI